MLYQLSYASLSTTHGGFPRFQRVDRLTPSFRSSVEITPKHRNTLVSHDIKHAAFRHSLPSANQPRCRAGPSSRSRSFIRRHDKLAVCRLFLFLHWLVPTLTEELRSVCGLEFLLAFSSLRYFL